MTLTDVSIEEVGASEDGSSNSSDSYPITEERVPYAAIWYDQDGEYHWGLRPSNQFIVYEKKSSSSGWSRKFSPENLERYWMDQMQFNKIVSIVSNELDIDLIKLLNNDPKKALSAIRRAAKRHSPQSPNTLEWDCAVCGDSIHVVYDEYEEFSNRKVHTSHSIQDVKEAGLLR